MGTQQRSYGLIELDSVLLASAQVDATTTGSPRHHRRAAGLVDLVQVTIFPVITGQTGTAPIFQGAADFDLDLIESRSSRALAVRRMRRQMQPTNP